MSTGPQACWEALLLMPPLHEHHLETHEGNVPFIVPYIHLFYAYPLLGAIAPKLVVVTERERDRNTPWSHTQTHAHTIHAHIHTWTH